MLSMDYFPSRTARKLILVVIAIYLVTNVVKDDLMKGVIILGSLYILMSDIEGIDNNNDGIEDDLQTDDAVPSVSELDAEVTEREAERIDQESIAQSDNDNDNEGDSPAIVSGNNVKSGGGEKGPDIKASSLNTGPYDGLCLKTGNKEYWMKSPDETSLVPNEGLYTYLSSQGPIKMKLSDQSALRGPPVDGVDGSVEKMFMFANNISSPLCCPSTFTTSTGCMCTTKNQRDFIASRGYLDDISENNESVNGPAVPASVPAVPASVPAEPASEPASEPAVPASEPAVPASEPAVPASEPAVPSEPSEPASEPAVPAAPTPTTGSP
jgi:hypothetical protein